MPRYFFHVMNGKASIDDVGAEFSTLDQVRSEAIRAAGQMLGSGEQVWNGNAWQMIVADEARTIVFGLTFSMDRHGL